MMKEMLNVSDAIAAPLCSLPIWCFFTALCLESLRPAGFFGRLLSAFPSRSALHCIVHLFVSFFFPWVVTSGYTIMLSVL